MADLRPRNLLAALPVMTPTSIAALATRLATDDAVHADAALLRLEAELELQHAAWVRTLLSDDDDVSDMRDEEKAAEACDELAEAVRLLPAKTLDGLLVKVRVLSWDLRLSVDIMAPRAGMDWGPRCYVALIREVGRMAAETGLVHPQSLVASPSLSNLPEAEHQ